MEQQLQQMLRQLPSKTEMPDLIVDVSQTALATGIPTNCSSPAPRLRKSSMRKADFVADGGFLSPIRGLRQRRGFAPARGDPHHARHLAQAQEPEQGRHQANTPLELAGTVKTYRYLDAEEAAAQEKAAATAGKGGR
jgi:type IV pilus assembly protein PilO